MRSLDDFPRISLGLFPTPIHRLENISAMLGTNVYIKRDDLCGLGLGGNKIRKLEFLLADAKTANLMFTNWLNYFVYQETPYNIDDIK